jgi:tetratricopeptide (TPR) repeat protein
MATFERDRGNKEEAARCFREAIALLESLTSQDATKIFGEEYPKLAANLELLGRLEQEMGQLEGALRSYQQACALREKLAKANPSHPSSLRAPGEDKMAIAALYRKLRRAGEERQCLREAAAWLAQVPRDKVVLVNRAACAALLSTLAADDEERRRLADQAMDLLRQGIAAGYADGMDLKTSSDFDALRARPDFQKLVAELEAKLKKPAK